MTRFIELTARGQTGSGKTLLLNWIVNQLGHVGITGAYVKNEDDHRILLEFEDSALPRLAAFSDTTMPSMKRMLLDAEEIRLIEEHRLSKGY